jgi:flagellar L-ring protein precursor FlgH
VNTRVLAFAAALCLASPAAHGADLFTPGHWSALASDRGARNIGDSLTVLIAENSIATDSATNNTHRSSHFGGTLASGDDSHAGALDLDSSFDGAGQVARAHQMLAQISVVVDAILPNGDLHVSGAQALNINGERTNIRLSGRVRPEDIAPDNTIVSTRLAEASIDYDGARRVRPGVLTRLFNWLGLP